MGEIRDWWGTLPGSKKLGYSVFSSLLIATIALHLYNERKYIYDPTKKLKKVSKWE